MKIKQVDGNVGLVQRVEQTVSSVGTSPVIGSFAAPREGIIKRLRVSGESNLTSFTFAIAESDCFTSGSYDSIEVIAGYKVNEPRTEALAASTLYVVDEAAGDLYYQLSGDYTGKSRNYGEMFYLVFTDNASATTINIKLDIEPIA